MFINKLGLKNFKCFKEVEVEFSKITLLTGENSSGKSSLIYGLLAPFQSEGFPLYLFPNGKYVNMGDFEEISFKNSKNNQIGIHISINTYPSVNSPRFDLSTAWILDPINQLPKLYYSKVYLISQNTHGESSVWNKTLKINFYEDSYQCNFYEEDKLEIVKNLKIDDLDEIYNKYIVKPVLVFSLNVMFKSLDKGIIEFFGPYGLLFIFSNWSNKIIKIQTGFIFHYSLLIFLSLIFLISIIFISIYINVIFLFIFLFIIFLFL